MTPAARLYRAAVAFLDAGHRKDEAAIVAADTELRDAVNAYEHRIEHVPGATATELDGVIDQVSIPHTLRMRGRVLVEDAPHVNVNDDRFALVLRVLDGAIPFSLHPGDELTLRIEKMHNSATEPERTA